MSTIVRAWTVGGAIEEILERVSFMYGTEKRYPKETLASWEARQYARRALVVFAEELSGAFAPDKDTLIGEVDLPR